MLLKTQERLYDLTNPMDRDYDCNSYAGGVTMRYIKFTKRAIDK